MTEENVSSENQELAQEALNAAEEQTPADEPTVPLHKHTALRTRTQAAELEAATLRGRIEGLQEAQTKAAPAQMSPIEIEAARQIAAGDISTEDEMAISPALYRKQKVYETQQANVAAKATAENQLRLQQGASKTKAMAAHDDFNDVIMAGQNYLTQGELLDLENAGADFGEQCYGKCKQAAERAKPEPKPEKPAPNESKSEAEKAAKEKAEVQSQAEILKGLGGDPIADHAAML